MSDDLTNAIEDMKAHIGDLVAAGFYSADEVEMYAVDYFTDEIDPDLLRIPAKELTKEAFDAHRAEQATWPDTTDCDRLDAAFAELEESGIVSRQNFSCCGTCGTAEIDEPIDAAKAEGKDVRGYTFYHQQDTDSAVEGYGVFLNYGGVDGGRKSALAIAHEVVSVLRKHGLGPEWNGSVWRRISVPLDWKRRIDVDP